MKKAYLLFVSAACVVMMFASISSCNKKDDNPTTLTLYDSLGGTKMVADPNNAGTMIEQGRLDIRSVVDSTIFVVAVDPEINGYFSVLLSEVSSGDLSGFQKLSKNLTDFFCVATGAKNFSYTGLSMTAAHNPDAAPPTGNNSRIKEKVADDDFTAFIDDLGKGAQQNALPDYLIARVAAVAETVRGSVVQR